MKTIVIDLRRNQKVDGKTITELTQEEQQKYMEKLDESRKTQ